MGIFNVLLTAAMLAIMAMVASRVTGFGAKKSLADQLRQEATLKAMSIVDTLSDPDACEFTLKGHIHEVPIGYNGPPSPPNTATNVFDANNAIKFPVPGQTQSRVQFEKIELLNVVENAPSTALLRIKLSRGQSNTKRIGGAYFTKKITLDTTLDSIGLIDNCTVTGFLGDDPINSSSVNPSVTPTPVDLDDQEACEVKGGVWLNEQCFPPITKNITPQNSPQGEPWILDYQTTSWVAPYEFLTLDLPPGPGYKVKIRYFYNFFYDNYQYSQNNCTQGPNPASLIIGYAGVICSQSSSCTSSATTVLKKVEGQSISTNTNPINYESMIFANNNLNSATNINGYHSSNFGPTSATRTARVTIGKALRNCHPSLRLYIYNYTATIEAIPFMP